MKYEQYQPGGFLNCNRVIDSVHVTISKFLAIGNPLRTIFRGWGGVGGGGRVEPGGHQHSDC